MKRGSKRKASASVSSEARIAADPTQQHMELTPIRLDLNLPPTKAVDSSCRGCQRSARGHKQGLRTLQCECLWEEIGPRSPALAHVDIIAPSLQVPNTSTTNRISSEARIVDDPTQQHMELTPIQLDLNLPPTKPVDSSCRVCQRTARGHKQGLRTLQCECLWEEIGPRSPALALVDVIVPSLQVPNTSTTNNDVPLAAIINVRVPSLPVMKVSTTNSDAVISSASSASVNVKVPTLPVASGSFSLIDAAAGPKSQTGSNEVTVKEVHAQSKPVVSTVSFPSSSLTSTAAGSVIQISTNKQAPPVDKQVNNDPFSNMRLNIDNMSYEELLALQESIGYVSTGLSGKELVKARKVATYLAKRRKTTKDTKVDSKCSICQEEYVTRDKLGNLKCKHRYHLSCIEHWLRQNNWCPTCKTDVRACS